MLGLVDRLIEERGVSVLVTTGTVTAARLIEERADRGASSINSCRSTIPVMCAAFLDHWRPDLAMWVESELWPNLISAATRAGHADAAVERTHVAALVPRLAIPAKRDPSADWRLRHVSCPGRRFTPIG